MTTRADGPTGPTDDRADSDVGTDPMHPHPQDRPPGDESERRAAADRDEPRPPEHDDDDRGEPRPPDDDDDDRDAAGRTDDSSPVERYRDSPGAAAARPMSEPGPVPEPNEPG